MQSGKIEMSPAFYRLSALRSGRRRDLAFGALRLEFELLLRLVQDAGQALCQKNCLGTATCGMCIHRAGQLPDIRFDFRHLFRLGKAHQSAQCLSENMSLAAIRFFAQSCTNQILDEVVSCELCFHGLKVVEWKNFL